MSGIFASLPNDLQNWLQTTGQPAFRYRQIVKWLFSGRAGDFDDMTDLPQALRQQLQEAFRFWTTEIARHTVAEDGTEKLLLRFQDGSEIECVLLRDGERRTICISTQVGCAMGCVFCASGLDGVKRNLSFDEIVEQMLRLQRLLPKDERLSHIVVMGMGEPLANLDQLLPALDWAHHSTGLGISARRITISSVGLPRAIDRLAEFSVPYHLAISLHAPNDTLRNRLVPVNDKIGLQAIMESSDRYFAASGRRLTFEYVLLADENDRVEDAQQLASLLRGRNAMLNVIPYNPVEGLPYRTPNPLAVQRFCKTLSSQGIQVQIRQRKGDKIDAACGQLRRQSQRESPQTVSLEGSSGAQVGEITSPATAPSARSTQKK